MRWSLLVLSILLLFNGIGGETTVNGYFKSFGTFIADNSVNGGSEGGFRNRLRLKLLTGITENIDFEGAWDLSSNIKGFSSGYDTFRVGLGSGELISGDGIGSGSITHNPDRFFFTFRVGAADLIVGRQAVAWGSAKFINPTDTLTPFLFSELDQEERLGVDAVRIRLTIGEMDEIDIGYVGGDKLKWKKSSFFIRSKHNIFNTDLSLLFQIVRKHTLVGVDLTRSLGQAGVWLEGTYLWAKDKEGRVNDDFLRLSVGVDYNFWGELYTYLEYHYNGAETHGFEYKSSYEDIGGYLKGKHYGVLGTKIDLHPLIPFNFMGIYNFSDNSLILAPDIEYNIAENFYISVGAYIGLGRTDTEFNKFPDMFYTSLRFYF